MSLEDAKFRRIISDNTLSNQSIDWGAVIELFPEHSLNELKKKWQALQDAATQKTQSNSQSNSSNQRASSDRIITIETPFSINSESIGHSISPRSVVIDQNNCQSLGLDRSVPQFASVIIDLVGSDSQSTSDGYRVFDPRSNVSRKRSRESAQLSKSQNSLSSFDSESEDDQSNNRSTNRCNYQFTYRGKSRRCEQVIALPQNMRTHQLTHTKRDGSHQCSLCGWSAAANQVRTHITAAHSALDAELRSLDQPTAHVIPSTQSIDEDDDDSCPLTEEEADTVLGAVSDYTQSKQKIKWSDISSTLLPHYTAAYLRKAYQSINPASRSSRHNKPSNRSSNEYENSTSASNRHQCDFTWIDEGITRRCEQVAERADTIAKHAPLHFRKDGSHQCSHCGLSSSHSAVKAHMTRCHRALDAELARTGRPVGRILERLQTDSDDDEEMESDNEQFEQADQYDQRVDHHGLAPAASEPWTPDEDVMLLDAVSAHRDNGLIRWTDFHDMFFVHRCLEAIQDRYNRQLRGKRALDSVPSPSYEHSPSSNISSTTNKSSSSRTNKLSSSSPTKSLSLQDEDEDEYVDETNGPSSPERVTSPAGFVAHYTTQDAETVSDNQLYVGDWALSCQENHSHVKPNCYAFHGHGTLTMSDGVSYYEGEFLNGEFHGAGWFDTPTYGQWGDIDGEKVGLVVRYLKNEGVISNDVVFVGGVAGDDLRAGVLCYPDGSRVVGHRFDSQGRVKKSGYWEFAADSLYQSYIGEMDAHKPHGVGQVVIRSNGETRFVQTQQGNITLMLSQAGTEMIVPQHERDMFKQTAAPPAAARTPKRPRQIVDSDEEEAEFEAPPLKRSGTTSRSVGDVDAPSDLDEIDQPKQKQSSTQKVKWTERENSIITKFVQIAAKKKVAVDWKNLSTQLPGRDIEAIKPHAKELVAKSGPRQQNDGDDSDDEDVSENDDDEYREPRHVVPIAAQPKRIIPRKSINGPKVWSAAEIARLIAATKKHRDRYGMLDLTAIQQLFSGVSRNEISTQIANLKKQK